MQAAMMAAAVPGRPIPRPSARFIPSLVPNFEPLPETPEGGTVYVRDLDVLVDCDDEEDVVIAATPIVVSTTG